MLAPDFDRKSSTAYNIQTIVTKNKKEFIIKIIRSTQAMQEQADKIRSKGKTIAFVPTMGFLHEGHLSLIRAGQEQADYTVLSIFVNPTQFAPGEDLDSYPQSFEKDSQAAASQGVDIIFAPDKANLYDDNFETYVTLEHLPGHLCGLSRPTHFRGVATIVAKLFNIVKPHVAVFGEKDYQQLAVLRRMTRDLNFDIKIVGAPIIREKDGLALSSRNTYLSKGQRPAALSLHQSLLKAQNMVASGTTAASEIREAATAIIGGYLETEIDYISLSDPDTLAEVETITGPTLMALAVQIGSACRLIDNMLLNK